MNEAKFYSSLIDHSSFMIDQLKKGPNFNEIEAMIDGWPPSAVKPLHSFIIFIMSLLIGLHDYTGQVMSAFFSIIMLFLVFFMVAKYDDLLTAFLALIILTFSPYHIMFSRAAFPEMNSIVFYLIASLFYLTYVYEGKKSVWKLVGVGLFFALTLATNYRWFMLIPTFIVFEFFLKGDALQERVKRLSIIFITVVVVVLTIDLPYKFLLPANTLPTKFGSYKEQFLYYIVKIYRDYKLSLFTFRSLYMRLYIHFNGIIKTGFLLTGTFFFLGKKRTYFINYALVVFYFVFLGLTFVNKGQFARYNSIIYPFGALHMV
ncbi:ArnT family glycosyltransferase [Candidatus Omnitrophota bacterium]